MYHINTHLNGKTECTPEDFPLLKNGLKFAMYEAQGAFYIQTTIGDNETINYLIRKGVKHLYENAMYTA